MRCAGRTGRAPLTWSSRDLRSRLDDPHSPTDSAPDTSSPPALDGGECVPSRPRGCSATALHKEPPFWRQYRLQWWAEWWAVKQKRIGRRLIAGVLADRAPFPASHSAQVAGSIVPIINWLQRAGR